MLGYKLCCPIAERSLPLLAALSHDCYSLTFPVDIVHFDIHQLIKPDAAVNEQANDCLIPDIAGLPNQIFNLMFIQTRQQPLRLLRGSTFSIGLYLI